MSNVPNAPASNDFVLVQAERDRLADAVRHFACWCESVGGLDMSEIVAHGGVTAGMVVSQEAIEQGRRARTALAAAPASPEPLNKERRNNALLLASICQKARHSSASPVERDEALRDAATMLRDFARSVAPAASPEPASNEAAGRGGVEAAEGSLNYRVSWPRPATPCDLVPLWKGEFRDFNDWVSFATTRLTGTTDERGVEVSAICVDALGRRCSVGAHFMRARDEGAFPVRYFWECSK